MTHGAIEDDWSPARLLSLARHRQSGPLRRRPAMRFAAAPGQVPSGQPARLPLRHRPLHAAHGGVPGRRARRTGAGDGAAAAHRRPARGHCIARFAEAGADGVMFAEDWGTQDRLLVSPATWRERLQARLRPACATPPGATASPSGCTPAATSTRSSATWWRWASRCCSSTSRSFTALTTWRATSAARSTSGARSTSSRPSRLRTLTRIERPPGELVEKLGCSGGGFIAGYYGGNEAIGLDPKWQDVACRAFVKYGSRVVCPPGVH